MELGGQSKTVASIKGLEKKTAIFTSGLGFLLFVPEVIICILIQSVGGRGGNKAGGRMVWELLVNSLMELLMPSFI